MFLRGGLHIFYVKYMSYSFEQCCGAGAGAGVREVRAVIFGLAGAGARTFWSGSGSDLIGFRKFDQKSCIFFIRK